MKIHRITPCLYRTALFLILFLFIPPWGNTYSGATPVGDDLEDKLELRSPEEFVPGSRYHYSEGRFLEKKGHQKTGPKKCIGNPFVRGMLTGIATWILAVTGGGVIPVPTLCSPQGTGGVIASTVGGIIGFVIGIAMESGSGPETSSGSTP